jgi:putative hydrolase of the HAD superfamily
MTRALLFDLDNTLILEDESTHAAVRAAAERASVRHAVGIDRVSDAVVARAAELWRASPLFEYGETFGIWWGELLWGAFAVGDGWMTRIRDFVPGYRVAVWRGALAAVGIDDGPLAAEMERTYVTVRRSRESIGPDAAAVLADVATDHRLAVVTNGASDVQREKLSRTPFADVFDTVVVSSEVAAGKPDPRIFHAALSALDVAPADAVMIGDSLVRDVAGARRAGIASVWIDRGLWDEAGATADARIERLSDLRAALDGLERRRASPPATA